MPQYKLHYFGTTGICETVRFIFSYAGQEFEDIRYSLAEWPKMKPTTPFGQMPILEIDGKRYHQSLAISRYLAKQFNLAGSNDLENLEIDAIADTFNDFRLLFTGYLWEANPEEKAKKKEALINDRIPFFLGRFTDMLKENGGYFYNGKLTWVDFMFTSLQEYQNFAAEFDVLKDHPLLKAHDEKIRAIPSIKAWLDKRPTTCVLRDAPQQ